MAIRVRNHRTRDPEKHRKQERPANAQHKVNKTYYCQLCKAACHKQSDLTEPNKTRKHLCKANNLATKPHQCIPCTFASDRLSNLNDHLKSKRHLKEMAALSSSARMRALPSTLEPLFGPLGLGFLIVSNPFLSLTQYTDDLQCHVSRRNL